MTTPTTPDAPPPHWHRALALALLGQDRDDVEEPMVPDAAGLIAELGGAEVVAEHAQATRDANQPWPHPLSSAATQGMGFAQLQALVTQAVELVRAARRATAPVIQERAHSPDEARLLRDVPPHHGG